MAVIVVTLAIVIAVVLVVASFLTREVSDWEAGIVAAVVNRAVEETGQDALFRAPGRPEAGQRWQDTMQRVERQLPGLVRCKVWTPDQVVLWSDSAPLIGARATDNADLRAALGGQVVVRLVEPALDDAKEAWRFSVLTRVYVPVSHAGAVQAVVELRRTPSRLARALVTELSIVAAVAAAGGLVLWLVIRPLARPDARRRRVGESGLPSPPARGVEETAREIRERLGFFPPFFEPARETPSVLENLWRQTLSAYVDNPLPAAFKEKLFAYLSRYCRVPYCIVCHSCALRPLGVGAADVLKLLSAPPPDALEITADLTHLADEPGPLVRWPAPGSPTERALIDCAVFVFVHPDQAERCQAELRRVMGPNYLRLAEFLAYVKTCHAWVEAHPELAYEADQRAREHLGALLEEEPRLAEFFRDYAERVRRERQAAEGRRLGELEAQAAELLRANEALRDEIRRTRERPAPG